MLHTDPTGDGRGVVDPRIILARNPESSACKMSIQSRFSFCLVNQILLHFLYDSVGEAETPGSSRGEYRGRGYEYSILKVVTFGGGTGSAYVQRVGKPDIRGWLRLEGAVFNLAAAKFAPNVSSELSRTSVVVWIIRVTQRLSDFDENAGRRPSRVAHFLLVIV